MIRLQIKTRSRIEMIDITSKIEEVVSSSEIKDGLVLIYVPHTSSAITLNEGYDPAVGEDIMNFLNTIIPRHYNYKHSENNSDAHIKTSLIGSSVLLILENGKIQLGRWQRIIFCEFDGPRQREIWIKII